MLMMLYEHHDEPKHLVSKHRMVPLMQNMLHNDKAVLVKEMANQLQTAFTSMTLL